MSDEGRRRLKRSPEGEHQPAEHGDGDGEVLGDGDGDGDGEGDGDGDGDEDAAGVGDALDANGWADGEPDGGAGSRAPAGELPLGVGDGEPPGLGEPDPLAVG